MLCATAVSPSLAPEELADCRALAAEWGLRHVEVETDELADPAYAANDGSPLLPLQDVAAGGARALGHRWREAGRGPPSSSGSTSTTWATTVPASAAAAERGAVFPLVDAGFTKADVRAWSSTALGLRTWDKPAAACLASRVPYGTPVTLGTLRSVAEAESGLRALGFRQLRVRHYGDTGPHRGARPRTWPRWWPAGRRSPAPCTGPATATSPSTSTGSGRAI